MSLRRLLERAERGFQYLQGKGFGGYSIEAEVKALRNFLPDNISTVLDVGGNKGLWTRAFLRHYGERTNRIIVFEPSAANTAAIEAIADTRVALVVAAVGKENGEATLHFDHAGSGLASLTKRKLDHHGIEMNQTEPVRVVTLDSYLDQNAIDRVDFVKMDIEGHELDALEGADRSLRSKRIRALSFEFGGTAIDTRTYFRDYWYFLTERGFRILRIAPYSAPIPIKSYSESCENFLTANYLAVRDN